MKKRRSYARVAVLAQLDLPDYKRNITYPKIGYYRSSFIPFLVTNYHSMKDLAIPSLSFKCL